MKAGKREKLRQWTVRKRAWGRTGGEAGDEGVRNHKDGVRARGVKDMVTFSLSSLALQIHKRSALKEFKSFISRKGN